MDERKEITTDKALQRLTPIRLEEVERLFSYDKDTGLITRKIQASQMHGEGRGSLCR